ncbi:MAG: hypothetical protein PVH29_11905 [Candidatus Zixiibacteriota bacterium]|jgi:hypothetical protein
MLDPGGLPAVDFLQARAVAQQVGRRGAEAIQVFVAVGIYQFIAPAFGEGNAEEAGVVRPAYDLPQLGQDLPGRRPRRRFAFVDLFIISDFTNPY